MSRVVSAKFTHSVISAVDLSSKGCLSALMFQIITCAGLYSLITLFDGGGGGAVDLWFDLSGRAAVLAFFFATVAQVSGLSGSVWTVWLAVKASTLRVSSSTCSS